MKRNGLFLEISKEYSCEYSTEKTQLHSSRRPMCVPLHTRNHGVFWIADTGALARLYVHHGSRATKHPRGHASAPRDRAFLPRRTRIPHFYTQYARRTRWNVRVGRETV